MSLRAALIYAGRTISFCNISQVQDQQSNSCCTPRLPMLSIYHSLSLNSQHGDKCCCQAQKSFIGLRMLRETQQQYKPQLHPSTTLLICVFGELKFSLALPVFCQYFNCIRLHSRMEGCIWFLPRDQISFAFVFGKVGNSYLSSPAGMEILVQTLQLKETVQSPCRSFLV